MWRTDRGHSLHAPIRRSGRSPISRSTVRHILSAYALGDSTGTIWPVPPGITFQTNAAGGIVGLPVQTSGLVSNLDQPRTHVFMASLQHDLGHGLVAEADYNGSHSTHLYVQTDVNRFPGDLIVNQGTQTRLNPNFGSIIFGRTIGIADGHYGSLMLSKRFTHSWQLRGIYTFGKATDDTSSNDNGTDNGEAIFNPLDIPFQHGRSDYSVAKRITIDSVVEVPPGLFKNGLAKKVLGRLAHVQYRGAAERIALLRIYFGIVQSDPRMRAEM